MGEAIYFTKVEFTQYEINRCVTKIILLDLEQKELSWQRFVTKPKIRRSVQDVHYMELDDGTIAFNGQAKVIKNAKTNFKPHLIRDDEYENIVTHIYAVELSDEQMEEILPFCNALDFEPYRNKEAWDDVGHNGGYRDEQEVVFRGYSNSYLPLIEIPMTAINEKRPNEKLYRYLWKTYFEGNKKIK